MPFTTTPISDAGNVPEAETPFPQFIQFQADGEDLGGPDVDTVNFGDGLTATRGTGETANVVTVEASGGGGGGGSAQVLAFTMEANDSGLFTGEDYQNWAEPAITSTSTDAIWDAYLNGIRFIHSGLYEVNVSARLVATAGTWPTTSPVNYGTKVAEAETQQSIHSRSATGGTASPNQVRYTDTFLVNIAADDLENIFTPIKVYAQFYTATIDDIYAASVEVIVRKISPLLASD